MVFQESETVELKEVVVDDIRKEIIAFANCDGGKLYIGVRDDGTVVGVDNPDRTALQISNMARDAIKPDITMFMHYGTIEESGKKIVAIDIQRGTDRPYYIAKKGMRPEGVCVRQGYSAVPATDTAIRHMIKETDGDRFEAMRSLNQDLTFNAVKKAFEQRNVDFGVQQMRTLKIIDSDGLYSNLAMLLSDQCTHTIKVAVFQGTDQTVFRDRKEFAGSLMQQMNDVYAFDTRDYPEIAVREALLNLLVHRDYSFSASALISIYEDRIEFVSIGGLVPGIELEDVMAGISICRNQDLANVFYRLQLIEAYGTGISKMMMAYRDMLQKPVIETTKNTFKIILPNVNVQKQYAQTKPPVYRVEDQSMQYSYNAAEIKGLSDEEEIILEYIGKHDRLTKQQAAELLEVSASTATRLLKRMVESHMLKRNGKARNRSQSYRSRYRHPL